MIHFNISLLTPFIEGSNTYYLKNTLTDYLDQVSDYNRNQFYPEMSNGINYNHPTIFQLQEGHYAYTYNEKFQESANSQKTLTFSINKKVMGTNTLIDNPFLNFLRIGSIILLEDNNNRHHVLRISNIQYDIQEFNTIYNITCQDNFSYVLTRQQDGYSIENDINSEDFIGALTIDDWAKKIVDDCYINYTYLALDRGLYQTSDGELVPFVHGTSINNVDQLLKEAYDKNSEDAVFFDTFPFAASGSAGSVLIALGQELEMQIKVAERFSSEPSLLLYDEDDQQLLDSSYAWLYATGTSIRLQQYFWFEPIKNDKRLNLAYYTPRKSVQSLGLTHNGDGLTTVLNVEGPTYGDEIITLLPSIPPFFHKMFSCPQFWNKTEYIDGMFTALCHTQQFLGVNGTAEQENFQINGENFEVCLESEENHTPFLTFKSVIDRGICYFQTYNDDDDNRFRIDITFADQLYFPFDCYDYISFKKVDNNDKTFDWSYCTAGDKIITPLTNNWEVSITIDGQIISGIIPEVTLINQYSGKWEKIQITIPKTKDQTLVLQKFYLNFLRYPNQDELDFAQVADACPWLENKIIDFKYCVENNIINRNEYTQLMNIFKNDLRKINGELIIYAEAYYNALHAQTKILAQLTNDIEILGAALEADFITPYTKEGQTKNNPTSFQEAYHTLFTQGVDNQINYLLNYDNIKADYLNKYFNAEQRFLKNIYNFKQLFNNTIQENLTYYHYNISLENSSDNKYTYYFKNVTYLPLTNTGSNLYQYYIQDASQDNYGESFFKIYKKETENGKDRYILTEVASKNRLKDLYIQTSRQEDWKLDTNDSYYSDNFEYYKVNNQPASDQLPDEDDRLNLIQICNRYLKNHSGYFYCKKLNRRQLKLHNADNLKINSILNNYSQYLIPETLRYLTNKIQITKDTGTIGYITVSLTQTEFNKGTYYKYVNDDYYKIATTWQPDKGKTTGTYYVPYRKYFYPGLKGCEGIKKDLTASNWQTIRFGTGNNWVEEATGLYKYYDAYIPISSYYTNDNKIIDSVTPDVMDLYYRSVGPYKSYKDAEHKAWRVINTILTLGISAIVRACANSDSNNQTMDVKGVSKFNLIHEGLKEYNQDSAIDTAADTLFESWADSDELFYANNNEDKEDIVKTIRNTADINSQQELIYNNTLNITPQSAAKYNLYYNWEIIRCVNRDETLSQTSDYVFIPYKKTDFCWTKNEGTRNTKENDFWEKLTGIQEFFSTAELYPLLHGGFELDSRVWNYFANSNINQPKINHICSAFNSDAGSTSFSQLSPTGNPVFTIQSDNGPVEYICCVIEDFLWTPTTDETFTYDGEISIYDENHNLINPRSIQGLTTGLWKSGDVFESAQTFSLTDNYFIQDTFGHSYTPIYTIEQLMYFGSRDNNYYYASSFDLKQDHWSSDITDFNFTLERINKQTADKENLSFQKKGWDTNSTIWNYENDIITFTKTIEPNNSLNNTIKTNGDFWYYFTNIDTTNVIFQERAIALQTQLTEYWNSAYTASKYCNYFIPETWLPGTDGSLNGFNSHLFTLNNNNLKLTSFFIPDVRLYEESGKTYLKKYKFTTDSSYPTASSIVNWPIKDMFATFDEKTYNDTNQETIHHEIDNWYVIDNGFTNYYYNADSKTGCSYSKLMSTVFGQSFPELSGIYVMQYKLLKRWYKDHPQDRYKQLKSQQQAIWRNLYNQYGYIILESTYKNESATNSVDLLKLAQLAFKDYAKPEASYNITVIDSTALSNYQGDEIRVGDGIRINAEEYWDLYDQVHQDLSQYLFITSLSYELRKATDISLGVDTIKYQDKLIQKLVKLIK